MLKQMVRDAGLMREASPNEVVGIPNSVVRDSAAAGNTMTPAELYANVYVRSGPTAAFTDTLPTGAAMDAAFPDAIVGQQWLMDIENVTGVVMTVAAGAGFTLVAGSPAFIGSGLSGRAIITKTGTATWTFELLKTEQRPQNLVVKDAAAAGVTITTAELWANLYHRSGPGAPFSDTLPLGTAMDTAFAATTPIGDGWLMEIVNASAVVMTVAPAAGFTLATAVNTIAAGARVACQVKRTAANTWTFEILG